MTNSNQPLVTVFIIYTGCDDFIDECLVGIFGQKTKFEIEIFLVDGGFSNALDKINIQHIEQFKDKIHIISNKSCVNDLYAIDQWVRNFNNSLHQAKGKYFAFCKTNDYWHDPDKLQRQVDFLNDNPEYVLVAENSLVHNTMTGGNKQFSELAACDLEISELLQERLFITSSVLFRNIGKQVYVDDLYSDIILWSHLIKVGKFRYQDNVSTIEKQKGTSYIIDDKIKWSKKMIICCEVLSNSHPEVNRQLLKEKNLSDFKASINQLIKNKSFKKALFVIDDLLETTTERYEVRKLLYEYVEEIFFSLDSHYRQKSEQLHNIQNSLSFKIGRVITVLFRSLRDLPSMFFIFKDKLGMALNSNKRKLLKKGIFFIDKRKIIKDSKKLKALPGSHKKLGPKIIISLTSFPERMPDIFFTLYSLLNQTLQADMVLLWLAEEQFPDKEAQIPKRILKLRDFGLKIKWCKDLKSYKKLVFSLKEFPKDIIVTADDDLYYPANWLEKLYNSYLQETQYIHCHRAHLIMFDEEGNMCNYSDWPKCITNTEASYLNFCTTGGGALYPPGALYKDVFNEELFMKICPTADDIWFWAMAVMNNKKIRVVDNNITELIYVNPEVEFQMTDGYTLYKKNIIANDGQIQNVIRHYGEIVNKMTNSNE